jgi:hypothetical protein
MNPSANANNLTPKQLKKLLSRSMNKGFQKEAFRKKAIRMERQQKRGQK